LSADSLISGKGRRSSENDVANTRITLKLQFLLAGPTGARESRTASRNFASAAARIIGSTAGGAGTAPDTGGVIGAAAAEDEVLLLSLRDVGSNGTGSAEAAAAGMAVAAAAAGDPDRVRRGVRAAAARGRGGGRERVGSGQ